MYDGAIRIWSPVESPVEPERPHRTSLAMEESLAHVTQVPGGDSGFMGVGFI